jgi:hypothetical protein
MTEPLAGMSAIGLASFLYEPVELRSDQRGQLCRRFMWAVNLTRVDPLFHSREVVVGHQDVAEFAMLRNRDWLAICRHGYRFDIAQQVYRRKLFHRSIPARSANSGQQFLAPRLTSLRDLEQRLSGWAARSRRRSPKVNAQTASLIVPIDHHKDRRTPLIA